MEELDNVNVDDKKAKEKNEKKSRANAAKLKKIASNNKDKEARLNRRADRIAARRNFEGTGKFYTNSDGMLVPDAQDGKFIEARKKGRKIIADRKAARKQYLRNFASQLARGEQATPRSGFGEEGNPNAETKLAKKEKIIKDDATEIKTTLDNISKPVNGFASNYFDFGKDFGKSTLANIDSTLENINLTSPNKKVEDSTPMNYMQKEYRKKRGY